MIRILRHYYSTVSVSALAVECCLLFLACALAYVARFGASDATEVLDEFLPRAVVFSVAGVLSLYSQGLYDFHGPIHNRGHLVRILRALTVHGVVLWAAYFAVPAIAMGRGVFLIAAALTVVFLLVFRLTLLSQLRRKWFNERILIVGSDEASINLAKELIELRHLGYRVVGFLDDNPSLQGKSLINPSVIGSIGQVHELAVEHSVSRVIVAQQDLRGKIDVDHLLACKTSGIPVQRGDEAYEQLTGKLHINALRVKSNLIFSDGFLVSEAVRRTKRILDSFVAAFAVMITLPLVVLTVMAIRIDSPGPILFSQRRVGLDGKPFRLWKFRSMRVDAEAPDSPKWASENDPRVTRVGAFLRKSRIDELPQLFNVLVGDMSLVGPRPERPAFVERLAKETPLYPLRHAVRPGLTGWAQINAGYASSLEESIDKLRYDLYYLKHLSVALDISIMVSTLRTVLFRQGSR